MRVLIILLGLLVGMSTTPAHTGNIDASVVYVTPYGSYTPVVQHPTKRTIAVCLGKTHSYIWVPDELFRGSAIWLRCDEKGVFRWSNRPFSKSRATEGRAGFSHSPENF